MAAITPERIEPYLRSLLGAPVKVLSLSPLGSTPSGGEAAKGYGYGTPLLVRYEGGGKAGRLVVETASPGPFGHEHMADRAQMVLWDHDAYNRLPRHARSLDAGAFRRGGGAVSLGDAEEFFLVVEHLEGTEYVHDLARIRSAGALAPLDEARADALCDYLVSIHGEAGGDPGLYRRRVRELVGHGECIFGLSDSYPEACGFITPSLLEEVEHACLRWRWRLRGKEHRLRQVHGDFHPYNILFREGTDFSVLDRSRGEWGDPADDVTSITGNYLFSALQHRGRPEGPFGDLFRRFWERYLERSGDGEILEAAPPFYAFRCLVMASPVWYPRLDEAVRRALFSFLRAVLAEERFDPAAAARYCRG